MSKFHKGDLVKVTYINGDTYTFRVEVINDNGYAWAQHTNHSVPYHGINGQYSVGIIEKYKPPMGTFIRGLDGDGNPFVGVVDMTGGIQSVVVHGRYEDLVTQATFEWDQISEWGVIL